jgi:2-dehydropantoate 2-reductase
MRFAIFGAGAVGCWIGARMTATGADVTLIGRPKLMAEISNGIRATDLAGDDVEAKPRTATEAAAARDADIIVVTVKSTATTIAGRELAAVANPDAVIVSLQNGVRNAELLAAALPGRRVLAAMVEFNVIKPAPATYHRATIGKLIVQADAGALPLAVAWRAAGITTQIREDMPAVLWGKLVLNLNNAINALSGVPLAAEIVQRDFRRCFAAAQREALGSLAAANMPIAQLIAIPPKWMPTLLSLPDAIFRIVAKRAIAIDPKARSSMWDDFEAGRPTEIDFLQGEVIALADKLGRSAPVNRALVRLVRDAEAGGRRNWTGAELRKELGV